MRLYKWSNTNASSISTRSYVVGNPVSRVSVPLVVDHLAVL